MDPGAVISFSVIILEVCIGIFSGVFIVGAILKDVFKGRRMSTGDKIILSLSCSNMCLLVMTFTSTSASYFHFKPDIYTVYTINALVIYGRTSCAWLTTCLCFFYFIKITQLNSSLLSLLKKKIDVLIPWMILVIEVLCLGGSVLSEMIQAPPQNSSNISVYNIFNTSGDNSHPGRTILYFSMFVLLLISGVITARNALSLIVHICRMGRNIPPSGSTNTKVQRVVKTMVQLLVLYFSLYLIAIVAYCLNDSISFYGDLFHVAQFIFSPIQSILLILGNPRYKEDFYHTMCVCSRVRTLRS